MIPETMPVMPSNSSSSIDPILTEYGFVFELENSWDKINELNKVFNKAKKNKDLIKDLSYRLEVIKAFKELVPNFHVWMLNQTKLGTLYERRLDFIKDFIKFSKTGTRKVSVSNWSFLLTTDHLDDSNSLTENDVFKMVEEGRLKTTFPTTNDLIIAWCSKNSGFEDMLWSLELMTTMVNKPSPESLNENSFDLKLKY